MSEETFVRELERRADDIHGAPLSLETVRDRARQIRRRRRTAVAAGAAAAVAVAVLVPAVLTSGSGSDSAPDPAPQPTVPGASVLHDGTLTLPGGDTVKLDVDNADVTGMAVLTDGRIVLALQKPYAVRVYAPDGTLAATYPVGVNALTTSADDRAVAWVGEDARVQVLTSGVAEPATLPGVPMPGESVGGIDAVLDTGHLLGGDGSTTGYEMVAGQEYAEELSTGEPLQVTDVSPDGDLWAVRFDDDADPQYGCSGLYDPKAQQMVARNCDASGLTFAPDGQHLLGGYFENNMAGEVSTYDLDLTEVGTFDPEGERVVVSRAAWADPSHLVVAVVDWDRSTWSLVRVGIDGDGDDPTVVVPEQPGRNPESVMEYLLSE